MVKLSDSQDNLEVKKEKPQSNQFDVKTIRVEDVQGEKKQGKKRKKQVVLFCIIIILLISFLSQLNEKNYQVKYQSSENLMILFGETGAGKTSFVRSICEGLDLNQTVINNFAKSSTKLARIHECQNKFLFGNQIYKILDIPGFSDTEGQDAEHRKKLKELLLEQNSVYPKIRSLVIILDVSKKTYLNLVLKEMQKIFKLEDKEMLLLKNSTIVLLNKYQHLNKIKKNAHEYIQESFYQDLEKQNLVYQIFDTIDPDENNIGRVTQLDESQVMKLAENLNQSQPFQTNQLKTFKNLEQVEEDLIRIKQKIKRNDEIKKEIKLIDQKIQNYGINSTNFFNFLCLSDQLHYLEDFKRFFNCEEFQQLMETQIPEQQQQFLEKNNYLTSLKQQLSLIQKDLNESIKTCQNKILKIEICDDGNLKTGFTIGTTVLGGIIAYPFAIVQTGWWIFQTTEVLGSVIIGGAATGGAAGKGFSSFFGCWKNKMVDHSPSYEECLNEYTTQEIQQLQKKESEEKEKLKEIENEVKQIENQIQNKLKEQLGKIVTSSDQIKQEISRIKQQQLDDFLTYQRQTEFVYQQRNKYIEDEF